MRLLRALFCRRLGANVPQAFYLLRLPTDERGTNIPAPPPPQKPRPVHAAIENEFRENKVLRNSHIR
jgi:hypothetical protein